MKRTLSSKYKTNCMFNPNVKPNINIVKPILRVDKEYPIKDLPRILNLVLYNDTDYYRGMYENTREYYNKNENVDTIYYMYSGDQNDEEYKYDKDNNMLYIRGIESYVPGILQKTVKAFQFVSLLDKKYDYIIRTNISTLVNFRKLSEELIKNPIDYGAGRCMRIFNGWRDIKAGIENDRYKGIIFPSGTCIIFSGNLFDKMMDKIHLIDYSVVDDVSIGHFMTMYFREYKLNNYSNLLYDGTDRNLSINKNNVDKYIFFRNRNDKDRNRDVESIKILIQLLTLK